MKPPVSSRLVAAVTGCIALLGAAATASAQAWGGAAAGTGSIGVVVQRIDQTGHRLTDGTLVKNGGKSLNVSVYLTADFALTDRLVLAGAIPWVFGRYTDSEPPPPFLPFLPIDECRCWNSGAQDFDLSAHYNLINGAFGLTPSVSITSPSNDYVYQGEAVIGRNLREVRLAIDAGQRLDVISPRLSVQGYYGYAFVERVLDIPNNRSNARIGMSFSLARGVVVGGALAWQRTHGGLRIGSPAPGELHPPGDVNTPARIAEHDRLLRDNSLHAIGTVSYQFTRFDVFASYRAFADGTDTHAGRALSTGISWPFEFRR